MLCEECGKNQAEVLVTTVVNGQSATRHLCRACLKKYQTGDLQAVLASILSAGCAECYQAFRKELAPVITRVQGRSQHAGRKPPVSEEEQARQDRMAELRSLMEAAVAEENFEEAARLRDELRAMTPAREAKA